jgi:aminopeptidase-like protein
MKNQLEEYFDRLWPICRSITGNGLRTSFNILREIIPLELHEVPTGTEVYDWTIPNEWNIRDAYILCPNGDKIAQFHVNNLHVVNYSVPVNQDITFEELKHHLHFIEEMPDAIPYITSYYKESWGFCITYNEFIKLPKSGTYTVVIDSELAPGSLTYGELTLKGESSEEILFSTYLCHPSMANNELSGPLTLAFLYRQIAQLSNRKYTYRFVVAPETIGVIAFLSQFGEAMKKNIVAGYVLTCCGDDGDFVYKQSKLGNSLADAIAEHVLTFQSVPFKIIPFSVGGSDERQYCSPGFNMPVGSLTRSMYQRYPQYHTSLDNKSFISFSALEHTVAVYFGFVKALELNGFPINTIPYCEPQLGKRGLYPNALAPNVARTHIHNMMHVLSFADGTMSLLEIANQKQISIFELEDHINALQKHGIIEMKR